MEHIINVRPALLPYVATTFGATVYRCAWDAAVCPVRLTTADEWNFWGAFHAACGL